MKKITLLNKKGRQFAPPNGLSNSQFKTIEKPKSIQYFSTSKPTTLSKKVLLSCIILLLGIVNSLSAQLTGTVSIENLAVEGTNLTFDVFIRGTPGPILLGNTDFVLTFDNTNFTSPILTKVGTAPGQNTFVPSDISGVNTLLLQSNYFNNTSPVQNIAGNQLTINLNGPTPSDMVSLQATVATIDGRISTHRLGRFQISGHNGGQPNLQWKTAGPGVFTQMFSIDPSTLNGNLVTLTFDTPPSLPAACPTGLAGSTAPTIQVTNSTCSQGQATPSGGSYTAPTDCPVGATIQYSTDNGAIFSATLPTYNQTTSMTIITRCNCDADNTVSSQTASVTSMPATCAPTCPTGLAGNIAPAIKVTNSTCSEGQTTPSGGVITVPTEACPTGTTLQYSTDGTNWSTTLPIYNQTTSITVSTRCNCNIDNTLSSLTTNIVTIPEGCGVLICPNDLTNNLAPAIQVTNSTCNPGQTTPSGGAFSVPIGCPEGSTIQYSINNGATFSNTIPTYNQNTAMTVITRCNCNLDNNINSLTRNVTTIPGNCTSTCQGLTGVIAPPIQITNSICSNDQNTPSGGFFTAPTNGQPNAIIQYSVDNGTTYSTNLPTYNQSTAMTVITRYVCTVDNMITSQTSATTTVPGICSNTGGGVANCDGAIFTGGNGQITISNLTAESEEIEIIGLNTNYEDVLICAGDCSDPQVINNLEAGLYTVKLQMFGSDDTYCYREEEVTVTGGSPPMGIANCEGVTFISGNGQITLSNLTAESEEIEIIGLNTNYEDILICSNDCNDSQVISNLQAGVYTVKLQMFGSDDSYCYREEEITVQVIGDDPGTGGGVANCGDATFTGGNEQITVGNLTAAREKIEIIGINTNYQVELVCENNCNDPQIINNLSAGVYTVKLQMFGNDGSYCYREMDVTVTGGGGGTCDGQGGDSDGDSICDNADCQPNNPAFPATPNSACDDGNPNTENDKITADGCACAGTPTNGGGATANCDAAIFTGGNGQITIGNLTAAREKIEIIGAETNWQVVGICEDNCNDPHIIPNLAAGIYTVKLQMFGNDGSYCYRQAEVTVTGGGGGTCDGQGGDSDGDGICDNVDCQPNNPTFPATPNSTCDDGNPNTNNDRISADGCACAGTPTTGGGIANCDAAIFTGGNGQITLGNLTAAREKIEIIGENTNYQVHLICEDNCNDPHIIPNLSAGVYTVKLQMFGNDGSYCYREMDVTVTSSNGGGGNPPTEDGVANCDGVQFIGGAGQISVNNLTAQNEVIEIIGAPTNYQVIPVCNNNCNDQHIINNLTAGSYTVKLQMLGSDGSYCYREMDVQVTTGFSSSSSRIATNFSLAGYKKESVIALEWAHPSDLKKSYYVLEKSTDGKLFESMAIKKAEGSANLEVHTDLDKNPNDGNNYYRVFTQFENGETRYSEIINVPFTHLKSLSLFPNSVHQDGALTLNLKDYQGLPVQLMIHNSLGQSMLNLPLEEVSKELMQLKLIDYESGLYVLSIKVAGRKIETKTFIVSRL